MLVQVLWVAYTRDQDDLQWLSEVLLPSEPKFYTTIGFQEGGSHLHSPAHWLHYNQVNLLNSLPLTAGNPQSCGSFTAC